MVHVIVCGGGFGGLPAAHRLRELLAPDDVVTVVARDDRFFLGFAKLWALSGQRPLEEGTRSLERLRAVGIRYVEAEVTALDAATCTVETSSGTLAGDGLVVALGAAPPARHRQLLAGPNSFDLYDATTIGAVRARLSRITTGRVVIAILGGPFKCPPAPYEAALIVDRLLTDRGVRQEVELTLATPQPLTVPAAGVDASRFVADQLLVRGVRVRTDSRVVEIDDEAGVVRYEDDGDRFELLLGVPADAPLPVVAASDVADDDGWIRPDPGTFATGVERVYAIGDAAVVPTPAGALPHAGVFAAAAGRVAATNLAADLVGGERGSFEGHGFCFLELPDEQVAVVEGDFYADPPDVRLTEPDRAQFERKRTYERERLDEWLP